MIDVLKAGALVFVAAILQVSVFSEVTVLHGTPDLLLVTIICVAFIAGTYLVANPQTTILGVTIIDQPMSLGSMLAFYALLAGIGDPSRKMSEAAGTLRDRAVRLVRELTGCEADAARDALERAGWIVKDAVQQLRRG